MPPRRNVVNNQDFIATLVDEMTLLRQEVTELRATHTNDLHHDDSDDGDNLFAHPPLNEDRRWEAAFKVDIPEFCGKLQPDEFLDWIAKVDEIMTFKEVPGCTCGHPFSRPRRGLVATTKIITIS